MNYLLSLKQRFGNRSVYPCFMLFALSSIFWGFSSSSAEKKPTNYSPIQTNHLRQPNIKMITHTVFFTLKHPKGSTEEKNFFDAASKLATIPGVQHFERVQQISAKNKFTYGLTMQFASQALYTAYSNHPDHTQFVKDYWASNVADFMEIDYVSL